MNADFGCLNLNHNQTSPRIDESQSLFGLWNYGSDSSIQEGWLCLDHEPIPLDLEDASHKCDAMKTATVRDLRYDFSKIEAWLSGGEEILITKHAKPLARLVRETGAPTKPVPELPDYAARRKRLWGDRIFSQEEVDEMRAFETGEP